MTDKLPDKLLGAAMVKARETLKGHFTRRSDGTFVFDGTVPPWDGTMDSVAIACHLASVLVTNGMIHRGEINPEDVKND